MDIINFCRGCGIQLQQWQITTAKKCENCNADLERMLPIRGEFTSDDAAILRQLNSGE